MTHKTAPLWAYVDVKPSNVDKKSKTGEATVRLVNYTDVYYNQKITSELNFMVATASESHIEQFRVRPNDIIITKDSESPDDIGVPALVTESDPDMVCAYHLTLLRPNGLPCDSRFIFWMLASKAAKAHWLTNCFGVTRYSILTGAVARMPVPAYDLATQKCIADFLDRETGEIDSMIAKMDELARALEARRISTIRLATHQAADGTRWPMAPTESIFATIGSGTTPMGNEYYLKDGTGTPWVTTSELRENVVVATAQTVTDQALASVSSLRVHPRGSVVIAMYGATIGRLAILGVDAAMNQACCAFSSPRDADLKFFYYTLWGQREEIIREAAGGGQPNISQGMLRRWRVPQPPLAEQQRIADHLDEVTGRIDAMLAKVRELKSLLIERRAALITDVVTGRKEVA